MNVIIKTHAITSCILSLVYIFWQDSITIGFGDIVDAAEKKYLRNPLRMLYVYTRSQKFDTILCDTANI